MLSWQRLMKPDDVISYHDVVNAEKAALQKGMNFGIGKSYSVFLRIRTALRRI